MTGTVFLEETGESGGKLSARRHFEVRTAVGQRRTLECDSLLVLSG